MLFLALGFPCPCSVLAKTTLPYTRLGAELFQAQSWGLHPQLDQLTVSRSSHAILTGLGSVSCMISLFSFQLQSLYHNINFSLESLIKGDMKELKGVSRG